MHPTEAPIFPGDTTPALKAVRSRHAQAHGTYIDREPPPDAAPLTLVATCSRDAERRWRRLSRMLDRLARPYMRFGRRRLSSYNAMGYAGIASGTVLAGALGVTRGLPPGMLFAVWLAIVAASASQIVATALLTGRDRLVFLRFLLGGLAATLIVAGLRGAPALPYLDIVIVGFGILQAMGRVGCFMAGCCHGRAASWGVAYGARHRASGLPAALRGIRFLPTQLIESAWIAGWTLVAASLVYAGAPAGYATAVYIAFYALGRFGVEYIRGDAYRLAHAGITEAQGILLALTVSVGGAILAGWMPAPRGLLAVLALPALLLALQALRPRHALAAPRDLLDIARALDTLEAGAAIPPRNPGAVHVARTAAGLLISREALADGFSVLYTLSHSDGALTDRTAARRCDTIFRLRPGFDHAMLYKAGANLYHMACAPAAAPSSPSPHSNHRLGDPNES
ncbi:MAG: prolipoprotein diacylglyceryl transferase [Rhodothermales bacterium]